jgi:hypothetical protein
LVSQDKRHLFVNPWVCLSCLRLFPPCITENVNNRQDRAFRYLQVKFNKNLITRTWTSQSSFLAFKSELRIFHWYYPGPSHLGSYSRAQLVMQDRRHLFVTPCFLVMNSEYKSNAGLLFLSVRSFFLLSLFRHFVTILHVSQILKKFPVILRFKNKPRIVLKLRKQSTVWGDFKRFA